MLVGKSAFHKNQSVGQFYEKGEIKGYYSDLRHKTIGEILIDDECQVPINLTSKGETIFFPITIFQYGLGSYDMFLQTGEDDYLKKFFNTVTWALVNQASDGSWDAFGWSHTDARYSSMAQAEGVSLLSRAYRERCDENYINAAKMAIDFMLTSVDKGGTAYYYSNCITFEESLNYRTVLNGMIFSIWGLYDLTLVLNDNTYQEKLVEAVETLCRILPDYDRKYWSNYDLDGHIASGFYHTLHIEQLKVMYQIFENEIFHDYIEIWSKYERSFINTKRALAVKILQKLRSMSREVTLIK